MSLKEIAKRKVVTVEKETPLAEAARIMREAHVGDVVVVDQQGSHPVPIGILTDRDIVMATLAIGGAPSAFAVGDIMTSTLVTADENESVAHAVKLMKENGVRRIPLVAADHSLTGIISIEDVIGLLSQELSALAEIANRQYQMEVQRRRKIA